MKSKAPCLRNMMAYRTKIDLLIEQMDKFGIQELNLLQLIDLAVDLLDVATPIIKNALGEVQGMPGKFDLASLMRQKPQFAVLILWRLCGYIIAGPNAALYIDSLKLLARTLEAILLKDKGVVDTLINALFQVPEITATKILDAVIPLAESSQMIRSHLIDVLRKAMHSRIASTREMAVKGFAKLRGNQKTSNAAIPGTSDDITNEALCPGHPTLRSNTVPLVEVRAKL